MMNVENAIKSIIVLSASVHTAYRKIIHRTIRCQLYLGVLIAIHARAREYSTLKGKSNCIVATFSLEEVWDIIYNIHIYAAGVFVVVWGGGSNWPNACLLNYFLTFYFSLLD